MATIINLTPHAINLNNGTAFSPSGAVARVSTKFNSSMGCPADARTAGACAEASDLGFCMQDCLYTERIINDAVTCDCDECRNGGGCGHWIEASHITIFSQEFGKIEGLPDPQPDTFFLVSGLVLEAAKAVGRTDCLAPATGHPEVKRNAQGHIISVPGFVK